MKAATSIRPLTFLLAVLLAPLALICQQRDTLLIEGHRYVFSTSTASEESGLGDRFITGIILLGEDAPVWIKVITLYATSEDCNSVEMEVGSYELVGNQLVVYTAWDYTSEAMAGVCGFRRQVFQFLPEGGLKQVAGQVCIYPAPQNSIIAELDFYDVEQKEAGTTAAERSSQATFLQRIPANFKAEPVFGDEREWLRQQVAAKLGTTLAAKQAQWNPSLPKADFQSCL